MKKFLTVIDMQGDFVLPNGRLPVKDAMDIIPATTNFLASLDPKEYVGVLFTYDTHNKSSYPASEEAKQFPPHCEKGTPGWELVVGPGLIHNDIPLWRLEKNVFSMWEEPNLNVFGLYSNGIARDKFFENIKTHTPNIEVIGVAADYCVKWAVDGFVERGFNVTVYERMTKGIVRDITTVKKEEWEDKLVTIL